MTCSRMLTQWSQWSATTEAGACEGDTGLDPTLADNGTDRDERLASDNVKRDDDVMTEATSRTEDDPLATPSAQRLIRTAMSTVRTISLMMTMSRSLLINDQKTVPHLRRIPLSSGPAESNDSRESPDQPYRPPMTPTHRPTISAQLNSPPQALRTAQDLLNSFNISPAEGATANRQLRPATQRIRTASAANGSESSKTSVYYYCSHRTRAIFYRSSTLNHAYTNTIANSLASSQHSSQQYPVNITYRPVEGALYETPHAAGQPSVGGLNNFHARHTSLVNDPRLGELHGASRPLPQPWGHIS
ncbi:hypothetical protein IMY05_C4659000300 [Salix suchowensis]|nr:hypothetical protein IMY05_C4659000300 [Salix suchowensis]